MMLISYKNRLHHLCTTLLKTGLLNILKIYCVDIYYLQHMREECCPGPRNKRSSLAYSLWTHIWFRAP